MKARKKIKEIGMSNYITSLNMFIDNRDKVLKGIRWMTAASIVSYLFSIWSGNMFFNILGTVMGMLTLVMYYEFREMTDKEKEANVILERTLNENYNKAYTGESKRMRYKQ